MLQFRLVKMTRCDYIIVMTRVKIAELKAKLSEYLRQVRRGHPVVVLDRNQPIARLVPFDADGETLVVREPMGRYSSLQKVPLPDALNLDLDIVDLLLEERQVER